MRLIRRTELQVAHVEWLTLHSIMLRLVGWWWLSATVAAFGHWLCLGTVSVSRTELLLADSVGIRQARGKPNKF